MDNVVKIEGGYLRNYHGKYLANITLLAKTEKELDIDALRTETKTLKEMNIIYTGKAIYEVFGTFFISKKGSNCFRIDKNGKDVLIGVDWGGSFNKSRGIEKLNDYNYLYFRSASSNGGGTGIDWIILERSYIKKWSEEDF